MSDTDPPRTLAQVARDQARESEARWAEAEAGQHPELRPLDELEQARLFAALRPALPAPRRRWTRWAGGGAVAAAAVLAVVLWPRAAALPAYTLTMMSGDQVVRSAGTSDRYSPGSRVELVLQPAEPVTKEVAVTLHAEGAAGQVVPLPWPVERGRAGALRISTVLKDELAAGHWSLVVTIGDQTLRQPITVEGPP